MISEPFAPIPPKLFLNFYEPNLDIFYSLLNDFINQGYKRFFLVPHNETSNYVVKKFFNREDLSFMTGQKTTDLQLQQTENPIIIITELPNAGAVSELLLDCLNLKSGIVLAPYTENHISRQTPYLISIPKSGTHLLIKMLNNMGILQNKSSLPYHGKWNTVFEYSYHTPCKEFVTENFFKTTNPMGKHPLFQSPVIFMYRNPLDIVVSELSWFMKPSELLSHYLNNFSDMDSKLLALIDESSLLGNILERMNRYVGWLDFSNVIPVSYEELVGSRGGGSDIEQIKTIWSLQLKLHIPGSPQEIANKIYDEKSPTFLKGKIGRHKEIFKEIHYKKFKLLSQDFMEKMGYDFDIIYSKHIEKFRQRPLKIHRLSLDKLWEQRLIKESFYGFNIVHAGGQYVVISQKAGQVDLSQESARYQEGIYAGFGTYNEAVSFIILKEVEKRLKNSFGFINKQKIVNQYYPSFQGISGRSSLKRKFIDYGLRHKEIIKKIPLFGSFSIKLYYYLRDR
jgi:hypothetical protein